MSSNENVKNGADNVWHRLPSSDTIEESPGVVGIASSPSTIPILPNKDQENDSTGGERRELVCGLGPCRPRWLQWVAGGPKAFALWCSLYIACKLAGNLYIGGVINVIEKQFKLSSSESGAILITNDVVELVLVMFVSYFGETRHRPRIIGVSTLITGLGLITCALPHLIFPPYTDVPEGCNQTDPYIDFCTAEDTNENDPCSTKDSQQQYMPSVNPVVWLVIGQILVGIGNVSIKPLSTTYIDDTVEKHTTAVYIAFLAFAVAMGAIGGFILASVCLSFYVDFDRVSLEDRPQIHPYDPRYIGAWWLGFVVLGCMIMVLGIPFFFFPRRLPKTKERIRSDKETEAREGSNTKMVSFTQGDESSEKDEQEVDASNSSSLLVIKKMLLTYKKMVTNSGLVMLCLSTAAAAATFAAASSFGSKYFREQFEVSDSSSAVMSSITIPFMIAGNVLGAVFIRRRKLSPAKCALILIFGQLVGSALAPVSLLLGCDTKAISGISIDYAPPPSFDAFAPVDSPVTLPGSALQARSTCNMNCTCWDLTYNPVCGADGVTYVSPCYAGCEVVDSAENQNSKRGKTFSNCRCISNPDGTNNATAVDGACARDCPDWKLPTIIGAMVIQLFFTSLGSTGLVLITLRIVPEDMRAAAIGFQTVVLNLIGYFPAPVYFGYMINSACILWGYDGSESGACWVYDRDAYRYTYQGMTTALGVINVICLCGVYSILRRKKKSSLDAKQGDEEATS